MPTYVYLNSETGEQEEHIHKISEMDSFTEANPHLTRQIQSSGFIRGTGVGKAKPDAGFRDVLKSIKKASGKGSTIETF